MDKDKLHIDLIDKYLNNTLSKEELNIFNQTLESDKEFIRELNDMKILVTGIKKSAAKTSIEEKIERFNHSLKITPEDEKAKTIFLDFDQIKKYSWLIAACITILLVSAIALFSINQTPLNQKLYDAYFFPFENYSTKRGEKVANQSYWKRALTFYDVKMYDSALHNFQKIQIHDFKGTIKDPSFPLYKGNTLMKLGRYTEAKAVLEGMVSDDDGMVIQAKWYLSMCYLYENNTEKLIPLLEEIADVQASFYSRNAREILNQIR